MPEVVCDHKDECTSHPNRCETCRNNRGKKDYYEPMHKIIKPLRSPWYYPTPHYPTPYWIDRSIEKEEG